MNVAVPLNKHKHNRQRFDCGVKELNHYLCVMANQQSSRDNTRTFVLEDENNSDDIVGYYTLTMIPLELHKLPLKLQKKHQNARAGGLIARLAVDHRYAKKRFGEWLVVDALRKLLIASDVVAFPFITVDAKDGAAPFYEKLGFTPLQDSPNKLYMTIADVRLSLGY
jgi:predicted N-acetyltransferase YhbS